MRGAGLRCRWDDEQTEGALWASWQGWETPLRMQSAQLTTSHTLVLGDARCPVAGVTLLGAQSTLVNLVLG